MLTSQIPSFMHLTCSKQSHDRNEEKVKFKYLDIRYNTRFSLKYGFRPVFTKMSIKIAKIEHFQTFFHYLYAGYEYYN